MADLRASSNNLDQALAAGGSRYGQEWLLVASLLVALGVFLAWERYTDRQETAAEQGQLLSAQALAVEQNLSRQIEGAAAALRGVRDDLPNWTPDTLGKFASRRLNALSDAMPGVRTMQLIDRNGMTVASNRPELIGRDFSGREYFQQARARPDQTRIGLSRPFMSALNVWAMNLTIAVIDANGAFDGAITATLDPLYFKTVLRSSLYADDMWAAVAHGDGPVLMLEPPNERAAGMDLNQPGSMFKRHKEAGLSDSIMTGTVAATGEQRMLAQRTIKLGKLGLDKPLDVAVSRRLDAMFAPWWRTTIVYAGLYAAFAAASVFGMAALHRRQRAINTLQSQREADAYNSLRRLELALQGADLGLWELDIVKGTATVNERWSEMLGLPHDPSEAGGQRWKTLVHPDDWERVSAAQQAHIDGATPRFEAVYRMRHADGRWLWIADRGQVIERAADGSPLRMVGTHLDITERTLSQRALEDSEENLSITLQSIGDAVIATDQAGRVTRINATAERLTGWQATAAIGQPLAAVFRIFNARTREPVVDPVQQVLERGEIIGLANDTLLIARDGTEYQIADSAAPIRTRRGDIVGVVLVFSDVTESYRIAQTLRSNEQRLRLLLDNISAGVIVHAADSQIVEANPAACRVTGLTTDQLRGKVSIDPYWAFLEEDGTPMAHERYPVPQVLASGGPLKNFVLGVRRPDFPRPVWVLCNAYPLLDGNGAVEQIFVTFVDITERKEAGEELRLLAAAVSNLNDVVMITDAGHPDTPGQRIVFVNAAFERVTGWRREEAMGKSPRILQGPKTDAAQLARINTALRHHEAVHAEVINYTKQGTEYWVEFDIVPLMDRAGHATHYVAVERDITERKQAERERAALELQLREAQKMESIGTLAGGIAHDFNNILAAILGNVALAREDAAAGQPVLSSLEQINRAGLRARNLVQQILAFSRRDQMSFSAQAIAPVVHETLALLRATLPAGVQLDAVLPEAPLTVRGNSTQLQQVMMNLCTNAWHALPESGGRVEVGVEFTSVLHPEVKDMGPGNWVHLWVRDNGRGMDDVTRQRIFDPFFTTKPVGEGTGLGLSVVHGIVRAHDGAIAVDTSPGQGTTFHLYFPARENGAAVTSDVPTTGAAVRGTGQHVLYVDDDEVMVLLVESLLVRAGFTVTASTDATAAVATLRAAPDNFDVVVTDFNMPRLSGLEVARQVALLRPDLPVVLSSGFISESLRAQAMKAGVRSLLQKENTFEELVDLLQRVLAPDAA